MANIIPFSFRGELFSGTHNFASGGDAFKIALYTSNPYSTASTVALTTHEVSSAGSSNYERKDLASQAVLVELQLLQLTLQIVLGLVLLLQQHLQQSIMMTRVISYV